MALGTARFERRMDCILDGGNPLNFPCLENDRILKAASLLALLRDPLSGIAGYSQADLDGEFAAVLPNGWKGIGVDDTRIV